jgi:predicted Zn-dependent protease
MRRLAIAALVAVAALTSACATNPATGGKNVVLGSMKGEREQARRYYEQIIKAYGLYEDQALQEYVNSVGQRVAKNSHLPDEEWKFVVLDDESINAFTTGGNYIYLHRGLLTYLNSEAEMASVIGHEIGHVTARHPARRQARAMGASVLATAAAIATGSSAVAQLANIGAAAWLQGYGRENEMEADRLGLEYAAKTGYRPEAMAETFNVFRSQETFERARARAEGRDPRIYHGVFSSHPAPDDRVVQAVKGSANITEPPGGWIDNREEYLRAIDGMPYGSSRAQGIVRDNRMYHAPLNFTIAFPKGWTVENHRDRVLAFTKNKDSLMQVLLERPRENQSPREFLLEKLRGASISGGEALASNGMEGYSVLTRSGSPLDGGAGPVRWAVLYRNRPDTLDKEAFIFAGASRSAVAGKPEADGVILSVAQTLRTLRPAEFPLAEPYRLRIVKADGKKKLEDFAKNMPVEKYQKEELQLINALYPNKELEPGASFKIVE